MADIFFIRDGRLTPVPRPVQAPVTAGSLVTALLEGPTRDEAAAGVSTATGGQIEVRDVTVDNEVAHVNLGTSFASLEGSSQVEAVAQFVFTATEAPGVSAVAFLVDGQPVDVPRGDGTLSGGPLRRTDFPTLAPG